MLLSPALRRLALVAHVVVSVAFPGAVGCFLVLAVTGLAGGTGEVARLIYVAMNVLTLWVIVPLCGASLLTGVVSSLGTPWGLLRHWWVAVKLVMTLVSGAALLVHLKPIAALAQSGPGPGTWQVQMQLTIAAVAAIGALVFMTAISIYKPRGTTGVPV